MGYLDLDIYLFSETAKTKPASWLRASCIASAGQGILRTMEHSNVLSAELSAYAAYDTMTEVATLLKRTSTQLTNVRFRFLPSEMKREASREIASTGTNWGDELAMRSWSVLEPSFESFWALARNVSRFSHR